MSRQLSGQDKAPCPNPLDKIVLPVAHEERHDRAVLKLGGYLACRRHSSGPILPGAHMRMDHNLMPPKPPGRRRRWKEAQPVIKYVYEIDYPFGEKRKYLEWVRSISDTLQAPGELKRLASYDNVFSATPNRVVEFTFDSLEDAARYFGRKEISLIFQGELLAHGTNIGIKVLVLRGDYSTEAVAGRSTARED